MVEIYQVWSGFNFAELIYCLQEEEAEVGADDWLDTDKDQWSVPLEEEEDALIDALLLSPEGGSEKSH